MKRRNVSRRSGRRTAGGTVSGGDRNRGRREAPLSAVERRHLLQLVVCATAFVLLVGVKLLLPARMERLNQQLAVAMERNIDVLSL